MGIIFFRKTSRPPSSWFFPVSRLESITEKYLVIFLQRFYVGFLGPCEVMAWSSMVVCLGSSCDFPVVYQTNLGWVRCSVRWWPCLWLMVPDSAASFHPLHLFRAIDASSQQDVVIEGLENCSGYPHHDIAAARDVVKGWMYVLRLADDGVDDVFEIVGGQDMW